MIRKPLPRSTPEAEGIPSAAILKYVKAVEADIHELHSLMLVRHGKVVAEGWWAPHQPDQLHMLFSLSKSFTSTAIGMAINEGRLSLDDSVLSFFPEDAPAKVTPRLAAMQVRHLLSMSTGHSKDTTEYLHRSKDGNWAKAFLARPVKYKPGTHFLYNTGATYMLSAIITKVTGMKLIDYLQPRLWEPLGIEGATWEVCPRGINTGGYGLAVRTEDIARFGQLYLQKGVWNGQRLVSEGWVDAASSKQVNNGDNSESDWNQGYGYQFWRCRHGIYRGDGAFGQYCIVMPDQDAVLAITGGLEDMQAPLDLVWKHLLPAMGPAALPANSKAQAQLDRKLKSLELLPPAGMATSPVSGQVAGKVYEFSENEQKIKSICFEFAPQKAILVMELENTTDRIECGYGAWIAGQTSLLARIGRQSIVASGVWAAEDNFVVSLRFPETPFYQTVSFQFSDSQVVVKAKVNVNFGPLEAPSLVGRVKGRNRGR